MKRALVLVALAACTQYRSATVTFGETGEGLDGFLCKEAGGRMLLDRASPDAGTSKASLVVDIIGIENGQPGCRTGQLLKWCKGHECLQRPSSRQCFDVDLPTGVTGVDRDMVRDRVREQLKALSGKQLFADAPDEFVILRMVGTMQSCSELEAAPDAELDTTKLLGCVYSCPTLFDRADEVYLGFETLTAMCEQGVRICSRKKLDWVP